MNKHPFVNLIRFLRQYGLALVGLLAAFGIPIAATLIDMKFHQHPVNFLGFLQAQTENPVLLLVDAASVIVVIIVLSLMIQAQNQNRRIASLQNQISGRIGEIFNLKEVYQTEIKERQAAEARISKAKREWETTFDAISDLILITDSQGVIIRCNQATVQKLKARFNDILGKPIEQVFPGVVEPIQKRVINRTQVIPMPSQFGWFEVTGFDFQSLDDQPGRIYIFHDIAQRKRDDAELQRQKQYFEAIFQNSPVAIITLDLSNKIVTSNPAFEYLFGFSHVDAVGKKLDDLIMPPEFRGKPVDTIRRNRLTEVRHEVSQRLTRRGVKVDVECYTVPVVVKGEPLGSLVMLYNITDLVQAKRKAEEADLAKSAYLANISHEIRTPLNGLIGLLTMTLDTTLSPAQFEYLTTAADQAEVILALLNEVLDISKIEAGRMQLESTPFDLRVVMENVALSMAQRADEKGLELVCMVPPAIPTQLRGDPNRLRQILTNLVANAVKFTEQGEIVISVNVISESNHEALLSFQVQDSGIGIPADRQALIFDRYTQADQSTTRIYGGTGLGLSISAQLVDLMGGKISLSSQPGLGSTFSFDVEFEKIVGNEPPPGPLLRSMDGLRVLGVDPNQKFRLNLQLLFEELNCNFTGADSAESAIKELKSTNLAKPFDLIVAESRLAHEKNSRLIKLIHELRHDSEIKILITSRLADSSGNRDFTELGIDGILLKPLRRQQFHSTLLEIMKPDSDSKVQKVISTGSLKSLKTNHPQKILLAEDNSVNRKVAINLIKQFGHTVTGVENGRQALEKLIQSGFNLVLMDIQMPELDGYEVVTRIRFVEGNDHHTPFIALTGHTSEAEIHRCISTGMDAVIQKPFRPQELFEVIEKWSIPVPEDRPWLNRASSILEKVPQPGGGEFAEGVINEKDFVDFSTEFDHLILSTSNNPSETQQDFDQADLIFSTHEPRHFSGQPNVQPPFGSPGFLEAILPRFGNDLNFFINTLSEFIQECRSHLAEIRTAITKKDQAKITLLTHNFKGLAANFVVKELVELNDSIKTEFEQGEFQRVEAICVSMEAIIPSLEQFLIHIQSKPSE